MSVNGQGPQLTPEEQMVARATQPRPLPTGYKFEPVTFTRDLANGSQERTDMVELHLFSATGEHVTFWGLKDFQDFIGTARRVLRDVTMAAGGLWTPERPDIIHPDDPTTTG